MDNKLKVSETLTIGVDISDNGDVSVLQIVRYSGSKREVVNTMYGEEAEWTYQHLINNCHHNVIPDRDKTADLKNIPEIHRSEQKESYNICE